MLRKLRKRRRAGWELGKAGRFLGPPAAEFDTLLSSAYLAVMHPLSPFHLGGSAAVERASRFRQGDEADEAAAWHLRQKAVNTGTICPFQCNAQTNWCAQQFCNNRTLVQALPATARSARRNARAECAFLTRVDRRRLAPRTGLAARAANA
jgi:hypothetical protein